MSVGEGAWERVVRTVVCVRELGCEAEIDRRNWDVGHVVKN